MNQGAIVFTSAGGWFETAFAEWNSLAGAEGYAVYTKLSAEGDTEMFALRFWHGVWNAYTP